MRDRRQSLYLTDFLALLQRLFLASVGGVRHLWWGLLGIEGGGLTAVMLERLLR